MSPPQPPPSGNIDAMESNEQMLSVEELFKLFSDDEDFAMDDDEAQDAPNGINQQLLANDPDNAANCEHACWVFAYGSLCWFPGFSYSKCITGYIRGYVRRFWQGNISHRGTIDKPGRVATLVPEKEGITWGCAYRITGDAALEYLKQRECTLGGYATFETKFFPRVASCYSPIGGEAIQVLLYIATPENPHWLGEDEKEIIAKNIAICRGPTGYNAEYLLRLARFMHDELPDASDEHLFELEDLVLKELKEQNIPVWTVMGSIEYERIRRDSHENIRRPITFEYTSLLSESRLRCLNI